MKSMLAWSCLALLAPSACGPAFAASTADRPQPAAETTTDPGAQLAAKIGKFRKKHGDDMLVEVDDKLNQWYAQTTAKLTPLRAASPSAPPE